VSLPPFDEANLGASVGDDPVAVEQNRQLLANRLGLGPPAEWCWLHQVHGAVVAPGEPAATRGCPDADAAVTRRPGLALIVQTADCAPIALATDDAIGVVHAGWPGLLAGVVEAAVGALRELGSGRVQAALGPCVHPADYEFGRDDLDRMVAALGSTVEARTRWGAPALDLPAAVRAALARVDVDTFLDVDVCTYASPDHFSYRRDGRTGRQGLVVVLDG